MGQIDLVFHLLNATCESTTMLNAFSRTGGTGLLAFDEAKTLAELKCVIDTAILLESQRKPQEQRKLIVIAKDGRFDWSPKSEKQPRFRIGDPVRVNKSWARLVGTVDSFVKGDGGSYLYRVHVPSNKEGGEKWSAYESELEPPVLQPGETIDLGKS